MKKIFVLTVFFVIVLAVQGFADRIHLKSGEVIEGKINEGKHQWGRVTEERCRNADYVMVSNDEWNKCFPEGDIVKVEKEFRKPESVALLAKDDSWGEEQNGFRTQLIPQSTEFVIGQPMRFALVVKNVSNSLKWFDAQGVGVHDTVLIKNQEGNEAYYDAPPVQTLGMEVPLDAGEIEILFDKRDINEEYVIIEPGVYTIQFRGYNMSIPSVEIDPGPILSESNISFPPSNIIEFEVKPGTLVNHSALINSLRNILPQDGWEMISPRRKEMVVPKGRREVKGCEIGIVWQGQLKPDVVYVGLWQTYKATELSASADGGLKPSEYLGQDPAGKHYYVSIPEKAKESWPTVKEDIISALQIRQT